MNKIKKIYPFLYGAFGSLGLLCYISVFCVLDYRPSDHPYAHPFCVIAGSLSLIICITVFCLDIAAYISEEKKLRRFFIELAITAASFFVFIVIWSGLWEAVSSFLKYMGW